MQTTADLLNKALEQEPATYWTKKLKLARTTLATAKCRQHLSPALAGALAEELGEDVEKWMLIAALESERESACKERMVRRFAQAASVAALSSALLFVPEQGRAADAGGASTQNTGPLCIMLRRWRGAIASRLRARKLEKKSAQSGAFFFA